MKFFTKKNTRARYRQSLIKRSRKPISRLQGQLFTNRFEKKPSKKIRLILTFILLSFLAGGTVFLLFFSDIFFIKEIRINKAKATFIDESQITKHTNNLHGKNILFANTEEIRKSILEVEPDLKNITIKKVLPDTLAIELTSYPIVSNLVNRFGTFEKKFELASSGHAVTEDLENPELPHIIVTSEKPLNLKEKVMTPEKLEFALKAIQKFEETFKMVVLDAEYKITERELHLRTEKYFFVWLDMEKDLDAQLLKLKRAIPKLDMYNTAFQYIDLRIAGTNNEKIIYKKR